MIKWILTLSYLVTTSPSAELPSDGCLTFPDYKIECVRGAEVEELGDSVTKFIVLNIYRGDTGRKDCVDQSVRYAENIDKLPGDITLQIADGTPLAFSCKGEWE